MTNKYPQGAHFYPDYNAILIHIPKTGGKSVRESFDAKRPPNRSDRGSHSFAFELRDLPTDHFKFSFVRNPWDRAASYFRWRNGWRGQNDHLVRTERDIARRRDEFRRFLWYVTGLRAEIDAAGSIEAYGTDLRERQRSGEQFDKALRVAVLPQKSCIWDNGKLIVDFIGRFETLQRDYDAVCERIGAPRRLLNRHNRTLGEEGARRHYTEFYDDHTRELVAGLYREDIEYFGYRFDGSIKSPSPWSRALALIIRHSPARTRSS